MRVIHGNYFSDYQMIVAWETEEGWKFLESLHGFHPLVGVPETGPELPDVIGGLIFGQEEVLDFGLVRFTKSEERDPQKFNMTRWRPVVQAVELHLMGKVWGTCARVVFFGKEPEVRVTDDSDGKLLATLYGGMPAYVGMDFRFFLPLMEQAKLPDMSMVDVSDGLQKVVKKRGNSDDLFRIFQGRFATKGVSAT